MFTNRATSPDDIEFTQTTVPDHTGRIHSILVWNGEKDYASEPPDYLIEAVPEDRRAKVLVMKTAVGESFGPRAMCNWIEDHGLVDTLIVWTKDRAAYMRARHLLSKDTIVPPRDMQ